MQKIRLTGSEDRVTALWARKYAGVAKLLYNGSRLGIWGSTIIAGVNLVSTVLIYWYAAGADITPALFMGFESSFGILTSSFASLIQAATSVAAMNADYDSARPIFETEPEADNEARPLEKLSGALSLENVTFGYSADRAILKNFNLEVNPGEYVAVVGRSGCGKSTLLRLLLGFETPQEGTIRFDGRDIRTIDPLRLRQNMGVVMQRAQLTPGSIFDNIALAKPDPTKAQAWKAAEKAGLAKDIQEMPMRMRTIVGAGLASLSGGQCQRLMIAHALACDPAILLLDEATSALDNITQAAVVDSLNSLGCTRLVIALRLSTIKTCDRIVVIDDGRIVEDGAYDELIAKQGLFYELAKGDIKEAN